MLYQRYPVLNNCRDAIEKALQALIECYERKNKLLICGNGGSCADSDHIVGELMKGFLSKRPMTEAFCQKLRKEGYEDANAIASKLQGALPAISLTSQAALITAFANDVDAEMIYAQMVNGYGCEGDVLLCLSTSGNSKNVVAAAKVAKALGLITIAMTGAAESLLSRCCDVTIRVPETETFKVQELHLPVYHDLCARVEAHFFG